MSDKKSIEFEAGNVKEATKGMKSSDLWQVPYDDIYVQPGFNVREHDDEYEAHVEHIANLMVENGYDRTKPMAGYIAVIDGRSRVVVTDGHTRHIAAGRARERGREIDTIPFVTAPRGTSTEDLIVGLVTSNNGRPLKPYEIGTVCKRLISAGWEESDIAKRLSITTTYVNDLLFLHSLPKAVQDMVRKGQVSATLAIATGRKHGAAKATAVLQDAVKTAQDSGKKKASAKHVAPDHKKEAKKAAPKLYSAVSWVKADANYKKLSEGTRALIEELLEMIPEPPEEDK